jgi:hypothetical protein
MEVTMADAYANALKRQRELREELAEVEQFIRLYQRFSDDETPVDDVDDVSSTHPPVKAVDIPMPAKPRVIRKERGRPGAIADASEEIIRSEGRSMTRGELADALAERGIDVPSKDKPRYVGTILWRHKDRFANTGNGYIMADMLGMNGAGAP